MSRLEDSIWTRKQMIAFVEKHMRFVRTTEEFFGEPADGSEGGLWVSGEDGDTYKGLPIYSYWNESDSYPLGVLREWEQQLERRGWYSEWYDAGTVCIWKM